MEYKAEPVEFGFGKGIAISKDIQTYEQISARDGLTVRLYKAPEEKDGQLHNTDYHGIIFRPSLDDVDEDFEVFRSLTDRLTQASGQEIQNSKPDFMDYISLSGLEQDLESIGVQIRFNRRDTRDLPSRTNSFLNNKGHLGGIVTSLLGYAAGFPIVASLSPPEKILESLIGYGLLAPIIEGSIGAFISDGPVGTWCGPMHAPGFIASRSSHERKVLDPHYVFGKFMDNYHRLDAIEDVVGNQKLFVKLSRDADRFYNMIGELFPFTTSQRGFSIHYQNPDREKVVDLFSYLLEGGSVPQLPVQPKEVQEQEQIDVQPIKSDYINPWEIEIPISGDSNE